MPSVSPRNATAPAAATSGIASSSIDETNADTQACAQFSNTCPSVPGKIAMPISTAHSHPRGEPRSCPVSSAIRE
jgi:hypothetical protein